MLEATASQGAAAAPRRRDPRAFHPFLRLARLLEPLAPGRSPLADGAPINLAVGDPQRAAPALLAEEVARHPGDWSRYPPFRGPEVYRRACVDWLERRYDLPAGLISAETGILPLPGSREGLFFATLAALTMGAGEGRDKVLIPAPGYHVYAGAAAAAGAEPVFVPVDAAGGFLPDFAALDPDLLARTAIAFLCSPANPQGAAADRATWARSLTAARRHGFLLGADECYADIYLGETPPAGALQAAVELGGGLERLLAFHSLSKRSSAAGLRCGFVTGDPQAVDTIDALFRFGGAGCPVPLLHAGAALWRDEAHVVETRAFYRGLFDIAERRLGNRFGWHRPDGGFFLWLDVGDGEAAARRLWQEAGVRVLPGAYMCPDGSGPDGSAPEGGGATNPGQAYIRVALVYEPAITDAALSRLVEILG
jgi:aspartate/methionine/tyrosine aminotransferase